MKEGEGKRRRRVEGGERKKFIRGGDMKGVGGEEARCPFPFLCRISFLVFIGM